MAIEYSKREKEKEREREREEKDDVLCLMR
jgi:hypothetical protein